MGRKRQRSKVRRKIGRFITGRRARSPVKIENKVLSPYELKRLLIFPGADPEKARLYLRLLKEGHIPPPIRVLVCVKSGEKLVQDGRHRVMAAALGGFDIPASLSYLDSPQFEYTIQEKLGRGGLIRVRDALWDF